LEDFGISMSSLIPSRFLQLFPMLQSEYLQVLIVIVCPLILLLVALLLDLKFRRRAVAYNGRITFRASLAVRCAWAFVLFLVSANALFSVSAKFGTFTLIGTLLIVMELMRTFPGNVTIRDERIAWSTLASRAFVRWEEIHCFVKQKDIGLTGEEEYRLYGTHGQKLVFSRMVRPDFETIAGQIRRQLRLHSVMPDGSEPQSILDDIHRVFGIAGAAAIIYGMYVRR
jgi:hypothetical protein